MVVSGPSPLVLKGRIGVGWSELEARSRLYSVLSRPWARARRPEAVDWLPVKCFWSMGAMKEWKMMSAPLWRSQFSAGEKSSTEVQGFLTGK